MGTLEKEVLLLISRVRCITELQIYKYLGYKNISRRNIRKTLKKMCNDYTLKKYPINCLCYECKDNSYVYYLNGNKVYKGNDLIKAIIGTEINIRLSIAGYKINRFYRNIKLDQDTFDIYIEYLDYNLIPNQLVIDVDFNNFNTLKYYDLDEKIKKCSIPFFDVPKVLIVSDKKDYEDFYDINVIDFNITKLFRYI